MATQSDFAIIPFNEHLGDRVGDLAIPPNFASSFVFRGNVSSPRAFQIDNPPVAGLNSAYLLIQTYDISNSGHTITVNGSTLPFEDLPVHPAASRWQVWLKRIEGAILRQGQNTIQFSRAAGGDNFLIGDVVVHWRENA